jgi:hypothetical protein
MRRPRRVEVQLDAQLKGGILQVLACQVRPAVRDELFGQTKAGPRVPGEKSSYNADVGKFVG